MAADRLPGFCVLSHPRAGNGGASAHDRRRTDLGTLIHPFILICMLRMRPQDLPSSSTLLVVVLVAHTLLSICVAAVDLRFGPALVAGVTDTALMCGLTTALLILCKLQKRAVQTLTALAGAGTIIGFLAFPISLWIHGAEAANEQSPVLMVLLLAVLAWSLAVSGHILRHALSAPYYVGLLVSVGFYWISVRIIHGFFPVGS